MNRLFPTLPQNANLKTQNLHRYIGIIMAASLIALPVEAYLAFRSSAWQLWGGTAIIAFVLIAMRISYRLIQKGKIEQAMQVMIYSILAGVAANPLFIANIGIGLALTGMMLTVLIASQTSEQPGRFAVISFVAATITIFLDMALLQSSYRLQVPELQLFTPVITGVVIVILGYRAIRDFRDFDLRTKFVIVIISVVFFSVGLIGFLAHRSLSVNLTENVGNNLSALAHSKATEIARAMVHEVNLLQTLSLNRTIQNAVLSSNQGAVLSQANIQKLDKQWREADAQNDDDDLLVGGVINNYAALELRQFRENFPQHVEIILTNRQGVNLSTTNRTSDYYQGDEEWWQAAYAGSIYIGQPEYDQSTKSTAVVIAIPIQEDTSKDIVGILRTTVRFDSLAHSLAVGLGQTGRTVVYLPNQEELALEPNADNAFSVVQEPTTFDLNALQKAIDTADSYFELPHDQTTVLASQAGVTLEEDQSEKALAISKLSWRVIVFQDLTEAVQPIQAQTRNMVLIALLIFTSATFATLGLAQIISGPLMRLNAVAERVAAGDLSAQAQVETGDETGTLARTFNSMTAQLRDLIGTLEQRVAVRTKALATSAEISRYLSTILNERQLVIEVVEQLKTAFDYYHVHIYLVDEISGDLIMAGGSGEVGTALLGTGHKVSKGKGLVGRAAHNNVSVLVSDTTQDPDWLPNPLLPDTKSEAAVPIATANAVLGVLDVQDDEIGGLKQEDIDLLQSLANQIAIALLNARSYVDVQQRAEREARVTSIGMKIKSTTSIEAALQATARELGRTLGINDIRVILESPTAIDPRQKPD